MPFLKFSRDKRGYEHTYLVHSVNRRGKPSRPRVLYWYRSPPGIKVGRPPFDDEVRRTLEAQNPGVTFDWEAIVSTPMPPPDAEHWRERRRIERESKQARRAEEAEEVDPVEESLAPVALDDHDLAVGLLIPNEIELDSPSVSVDAAAPIEPGDFEPVVQDESAVPASAPLLEGAGALPRKRRRRRGGRKSRGGSAARPSGALDLPPNAGGDASKLPEPDDD